MVSEVPTCNALRKFLTYTLHFRLWRIRHKPASDWSETALPGSLYSDFVQRCVDGVDRFRVVGEQFFERGKPRVGCVHDFPRAPPQRLLLEPRQIDEARARYVQRTAEYWASQQGKVAIPPSVTQT
jgi:hypothetical protein